VNGWAKSNFSGSVQGIGLMRKFVLLVATGIAFVLASYVPTVLAQTSEQLEGVVFSQVEKRIIRRWLGENKTTPRRDNDNDEARDDDDDRDKKGKGKSKKHKKAKKAKKAKNKSKSMPKGIAKRKELPPGLAKRKTLPPGLAKRDLPEDLVHRLPPPQPGTARKVIEDGTVLLVEEGTNIVLDVLERAIFGARRN
jgi:hypothetical protein